LNDPAVSRILLALLLLLFVAHRAYYNRRFPPPEGETIDRLERTPTSTLAAVFSILALISTLIYIVYPSLISWASPRFPTWLGTLGVVLALAGFLLLEWSHRTLGKNWSDQPRITQSQQLVQTGPYKWIRHPIYAAFLLILGSTLLISANWLVGVSWIALVALDGAVRIRYEEQAMLRRFGQEYREYERRTGRLFPRL
jgi:protein-S-isoprenylcysteine O-methyltransferase Ste14